MNQFTIRDMENLCGIKAHTLRIWEQRYDLFCARRKSGNHRTYDCEDLKELLRISFLYHKGYKISKIAGLEREQINKLVEETLIDAPYNELYSHRLVESAIDFDQEEFDKILYNAILRLGMEKSIIEVFYPFLERIGCLWMTNHVIPAQEHFSSNLILKKIIAAVDGLGLIEDEKHNIGIFTLPGEFHEISILSANYFFRVNGKRTSYFGTSVDEETLSYYHEKFPFTHLYTHVITNLTGCQLNQYLERITKNFPETEILVSGPCSKCIKVDAENLRQINSCHELILYAKSKELKMISATPHSYAHPRN
jgi:MerR family transcriptional regulator, light-induced transcriptional regulator